jgi:hypothetical protein
MIALAFWMCSLDMRFSVECVFNVIFSVKNSKMTLKTHLTKKCTSKLHIQNASVINPLRATYTIGYLTVRRQRVAAAAAAWEGVEPDVNA